MSENLPLSGVTIGVTAERKADEFAALLTRRGAHVVLGPSMHTVPLPEDGELAAATTEVLSGPVDFVVAVTGVGFRGWVEAADHNGVGDRLRELLRSATLLARGAKARGAVRGVGLADPWTAPTEESTEILEYLLASGVTGKRVVVQVHGDPMAEFCERLAQAGAEVVAVPVYRWTDPVDPAPLDALIDAVIAGEVDALPFTSAPAAANLFGRADRTERGAALRVAMRERVLVASVGPVTAKPLEAEDVPYSMSERARTASLVTLLETRLLSPG